MRIVGPCTTGIHTAAAQAVLRPLARRLPPTIRVLTMPDPEKKTISATEAPALFNASRYVTRWMLYHKFAKGMDIDDHEPNNRMRWGMKMQSLIAEQVSVDKDMQVIPNDDNTYVRRGLLGCTRDAVIICPERGPGALEIKCVFDYATWMDKWQGGQTVPRDYEIQLQTQMYVGDGEDPIFGQTNLRINPYSWGLLAVWVCADLFYFERRPVLFDRLAQEAEYFFDDVAQLREPDASGAPVEAPYITAMFPTKEGMELDLSADSDHVKTSEDVGMYKDYKQLAASHGTLAESLRIKLLALAKDAEIVHLPCGVNYRVKKSGKGKTIVPFVPDVPSAPPPSNKGSVPNAG
jgi:hypothetical protein